MLRESSRSRDEMSHQKVLRVFRPQVHIFASTERRSSGTFAAPQRRRLAVPHSPADRVLDDVVLASGPVPLPTPETLPFWEGAARQELLIQLCDDCCMPYFYPRPFCPFCGSKAVSWVAASGRATLVSYIINERPLPPFAEGVPIIVAMVELEEGPRMMSNVAGVDATPGVLELDMQLAVHFVRRGEFAIPVFVPARGIGND